MKKEKYLYFLKAIETTDILEGDKRKIVKETSEKYSFRYKESIDSNIEILGSFPVAAKGVLFNVIEE